MIVYSLEGLPLLDFECLIGLNQYGLRISSQKKRFDKLWMSAFQSHVV